jgi:hypothetical protein
MVGTGFCVMGVALMMLGSFLVPVNAPLWADSGGGPGFHAQCIGNEACESRKGTPQNPGLCDNGGNPCAPDPNGGGVVNRCECLNPPEPGVAHLCRCYGFDP